MENKFKKQHIDLDEHDIIIDLQDWLDEVGIHHKKSGTGELILEKCPNCGKKQKMYLNSKTGRYNCFTCGPKDPKVGKGNIIRFGMLFQKMTYEAALKLFYGIKLGNEKATLDSLDDELNFGKKKKNFEKILAEPIKIPYFFKPLNKQSHPEAWNYLLGRGIKEETIEKLNAYFAIYGKDEFDEKTKELIEKNEVPRVIIMVYLDGQPMGFVARDITGTASKKVLNSVGKFRSVSIWNMDHAKHSKELVICEGIFSALQCGIDRSVALFGKVATEAQLDLIRNSKAEKIYICLDNETDEEQNKLFKELTLYFPMKIYKVIMPEVIAVKKMKITQDFLTKIESVFKIKINFTDESHKEIFISAKDKKNLKLVYATKKSQFNAEEFETLEFLAKKAEYKDSGDYSEEEMDLKIKNAVLFKKKGLLN